MRTHVARLSALSSFGHCLTNNASTLNPPDACFAHRASLLQDGSVWVCSLTKEDGLLLRFRAGTIVPEPFVHVKALAAGAGAGDRFRTIHIAFDTQLLDGSCQANMMYVLSRLVSLHIAMLM